MTDKTTYPEVIEHIGIKLWRANQDWKERFTTAMVDRGFHWYAEARGSLFQYMGPNGIAQIQLAEKAKISKQAVQQHLDDLEADGVIERVADPNDARKKHIKLTNQGVEAVRVANEIKLAIEEDYATLIGRKALSDLSASLDRIISQKHTTVKR
ncbi:MULTISPECIES: MarR family winged helix-turn-helix transcriptional regulator [unclassified Lentilitoribacter]|jgi:DNA-binding MarR family transcriptional regulator|uniref:MarR family winged helix-turn-helix transcriptional regulator n=1 Tax=unclassified Lentilitoribacter TaxID=2647570 RepID=UPI0013A6DA71|nr:MarR family transcriptional regulator [Lentilitoribacter sp. Alg239-R112]